MLLVAGQHRKFGEGGNRGPADAAPSGAHTQGKDEEGWQENQRVLLLLLPRRAHARAVEGVRPLRERHVRVRAPHAGRGGRGRPPPAASAGRPRPCTCGRARTAPTTLSALPRNSAASRPSRRTLGRGRRRSTLARRRPSGAEKASGDGDHRRDAPFEFGACALKRPEMSGRGAAVGGLAASGGGFGAIKVGSKAFESRS
ncbi:hypothetical protein ZWY2020_057639 [Hordeum vulgare]|nr:hypothetical protein ZWY2020_057639 [Hordeum vulgare]